MPVFVVHLLELVDIDHDDAERARCGDLALNDAAGPVRITTSAKDVECTGIRGEVRIEDGDGDISVGLAVPLGEGSIHNRNGAINLGLPDGHLFHVDASAHDGNVSSDLNYTGKVERSDHSLVGDTGSGGNGTQVTLVSEHGDIEVKRTEANAEAEAPEVPEAPEAPESGVPNPPKPPRAPHLKVPRNAPAPLPTIAV